jgi:hypothetical protein
MKFSFAGKNFFSIPLGRFRGVRSGLRLYPLNLMQFILPKGKVKDSLVYIHS